MKYFKFLLLITLIYSCNQVKEKSKPVELEVTKKQPTEKFIYKDAYISNAFDFPVGKSNGKGYYNAQKFTENDHLGEDWNGVGGGNTDLGDTIYAVANGYVKYTEDIGGGWGNVIRINHKLPNGKMIESFYAHCDTILINKGNWVKKGVAIATIGTANGSWLAHLHFEMRDNLQLPIGPGYSSNTKGYINPTEFINNH